MERITPQGVETFLWFAACTSLALIIGQEVGWGTMLTRPLPAPAVTTDGFAAPEMAAPFETRPADAFIAIAARPLFVATRSPAPPPPPPQAVESRPTMAKGQFALLGTIQSPEGSYAQLSSKVGGKIRFVAKGAEINGITVKEVGPDFVVLSQFDDEERLTLRTAKAPAQAKTKDEAALGPTMAPSTGYSTGGTNAVPPPGTQQDLSQGQPIAAPNPTGEPVPASTPARRNPRPSPGAEGPPGFGPRPSAPPPTQ